MLEIYYKTIQDIKFQQIPDFRIGSWIYAKEANIEDLMKISEITGLDLSDLRDTLDKYELSRIECIADAILLFVRHPSEVEFGLYTNTLTLILTNTFVIAISPDRSEVIEQMLSRTCNFATTQKEKLMLHILLKISQDYTNSIKRVRHTILEHEKAMKVVGDKAIIVMTKNEEILNQYLTALVPMRNTLKVVFERKYLHLHEEDLDLLEDLMIAIGQSADVCSVNIKSIRSLRDSYQILFTNDVNRTIKRLTSLMIIFTIPAITASIYGMNVKLPFQTHPSAFWIIMFMIWIASITAIFLFHRNRWL